MAHAAWLGRSQEMEAWTQSADGSKGQWEQHLNENAAEYYTSQHAKQYTEAGVKKKTGQKWSEYYYGMNYS